MLSMKVAFLDRDGTINRDYPDETWQKVKNPEILAESLLALQEFIRKGYQIIIITNQYLIGEGLITRSQYNEFNDKLLHELKQNKVEILDVFHCPHARKEDCQCRKPKTGLIDQALKKYPQINIQKSFIVGDSYCDVAVGNKLGLKTFGIKLKAKEPYRFTQIKSLVDIKDIF